MPADALHLSIKYCGGCNPLIDRGELAGAILAGLPGTGLVWELVNEEPGVRPNLRLVISGCVTDCAKRTKDVPEVTVAGFSVNLYDAANEKELVSQALTRLAEAGNKILEDKALNK